MSDELVLELHLALVPESGLASKQAELSHKMAQGKPALLELTGIEPVLAFAPHLTIYQFPLKLTDAPQLYNELPSIAGRYSAFTLKATEYASHDDGPFEVRYQAAKRLMDLQADVLAKANPLRGDLLMDRDPAGHKLSDLARQSGTVGDNIRNTGFDAVGDPAKGGTFKPHVTINVFAPGTTIDLSSTDLPAIDEFSGSFDALGFYLMGPYGTCAQRLGKFNFS